jgi:hypothetical protein
MPSGTISANGNTDIGGSGNSQLVGFAAKGTWGSGTLKLQAGYVMSGVTEYFDVTDASMTADGAFSVAVNADAFRLVLSGATAPSIKWVLR